MTIAIVLFFGYSEPLHSECYCRSKTMEEKLEAAMASALC